MVDRLWHLPIPNVTLLVVPDAGWNQDDIDILKDMQNGGFDLAGHGWRHYCTGKKTLIHKLHAMLISRNVAEHLSFNPQKIEQLIWRCFNWFCGVGLKPPALYVPPAWAMGRFSRSALKKLPFKWYETLTGVYDTIRGVFRFLPLLGYEADTHLRRQALKLSNRLNQCVSVIGGYPLRIAIHPCDFELGLSSDLIRLLQTHRNFISYADFLRNS
jgi:predicted deacetylase